MRATVRNPSEVVAKLDAIADRYGTDLLGVVTIVTASGAARSCAGRGHLQ